MAQTCEDCLRRNPMDICTLEHPVRYAVGHCADPARSNFSRHMHGEYEILLFLSGGGHYVVEDRRFSIRPYMLLIVPSNAYHFADVREAQLYSRYVLDFKAQAVEAALLHAAVGGTACYQLDKDHRIAQAFRQLDDLFRQDLGDHSDLMLKTFCTQILLGILLLRQDERGQGTQERTLTDPLFAYIEENLTRIRSAQEIAEHFYISASTLTHQFKEKMGISLMKYIRQKRLLLARTLLEQGEKPLEVAAKCGFSEYSTFYKAYIRHFGTAPSKQL